MDRTDRIGLPLLAAGQLQREIWINESFLLVDGLLGGTMDGATPFAPPASAPAGRWYRVPSGASGAWAGHDAEIATSIGGGWRFVSPFEGLSLVDAGTGARWRFAGGAWSVGVEDVWEVRVGGQKVLGARGAAIANPVGGAAPDTESRAAIGAILAALRNHGLIN